ncbi:MAG: bifunctional alpha,alpha-trehalose-phosphate synthase (UDP-forming)/trehalose-phosphatase [Coriobacteriia bacterium]
MSASMVEEARRLIIVSNRLPVTVKSGSGGPTDVEPSVGGLATGLTAVHDSYDSLWVGWPGVCPDDLEDPTSWSELERLLRDEHSCIPVSVPREEFDHYYEGFCNSAIWPLFHYFTQFATFEEAHWRAYVAVNRRIADAVLDVVAPGAIVWVHDYHLLLVPDMIRQSFPSAIIGFFLHIPWPSYEVYRLLPWRLELLGGLLGADLVGFHTYDYVSHFLFGVRNLVGHGHSAGEIVAGKRVLRADAFPLGIDFERYNTGPRTPESVSARARLRENLGDRRLILSIDRLDYTKGLLDRIEAIEQFLESNPEFHEEVQVVLVAVPSRTGVAEYDLLKKQVDEAVGRVNGRFGTIGWTPIEYMFTSLDFPELVALYDMAEVCLVTPLRDGMNLIAKEYVAAHSQGDGVLILSEMAGSAKELSEALIVNPLDRLQVANAIRNALNMPSEQRASRARAMQRRLRMYTCDTWARDFLASLAAVKARQAELSARFIGERAQVEMLRAWSAADSRLLLLDYDGTLVPIASSPSEAVPDDGLLDLLTRLAADPRNRVVIVSGRDRHSLESWLAATGVDMCAEHGAFLWRDGGPWEAVIDDTAEWKESFRPLFEQFALRTPGAFIEEKDHSLAWHFRGADPQLAATRARELKDAALNLASHVDLRVSEDARTIEVRPARINEGEAASEWLAAEPAFILAAGDDWTDEDLFSALPEDAFSVRVGTAPSQARWNVETAEELRGLLERLANDQGV